MSYGMAGLTIGSRIVRVFLVVLIFLAGSRFTDQPDVVLVLALGYVVVMLASAGSIQVFDNGVLIRNVVLEHIYPWGGIDHFEAEMRVIMVDTEGKRVECWAVQRANLVAMRGEESRVDRVVAELEQIRLGRDGGCDAEQLSAVRSVRLGLWQWSQLLAVIPAATAAGAWLLR